MFASTRYSDEYRITFLLAYLFVYEAEYVLSRKPHQLREWRQLIIRSLALENTPINPELAELLKIFDNIIQSREEAHFEKTIGQKIIEVIQWIGIKILNFLSFFSCKTVDTSTFTSNEAAGLPSNFERNAAETSVGFFSHSPPHEKPNSINEEKSTSGLDAKKPVLTY